MSYDPNQPYSGYGQLPQQPPQPYQPQQPPSPYQPTQYGAPPPAYPPPYVQPQPPQQKSSLRWLWITLGIVGGVLVLGCGGCLLAGVLGVGIFASVFSGPLTAVNGYYTAVQNQDYATAYSYLSIDTLRSNGQSMTASESSYEQIATVLDNLHGKVTAYSVTNTDISGDTATITVQVTRARGGTYDVTLRLQKIGNDWKITGFDNI